MTDYKILEAEGRERLHTVGVMAACLRDGDWLTLVHSLLQLHGRQGQGLGQSLVESCLLLISRPPLHLALNVTCVE